MNQSLVAERYAKALFQLSLEQHAEEEVHRDSLLIAKTCHDSRDLRLLLDSPIVSTGKKLSIIQAIFKESLHPITLTYLLIMVRKKRESFIPAIATQMTELYQAFHNILTVRFSSPVLPDEETRREVIALMEKYSNSTIDLKAEIDESLVGGFILKWKDLQYDASIRREIEKLRSAIAKVNLYKKAF